MNAYALTQNQLFDWGVNECTQFLCRNGLAVPRFKNHTLPTAEKPQGSYGCGHYLSTQQLVWVNASVCAKPARGTPRKFSFPGNATDRTPAGVVAHEVGHHIDHVLGYPSRSNAWRLARKGPKVSSYEPDDYEAFAETNRLFITNPALLEAICSKRFDAFILFGLVPTTMLDPISVLRERGAAQAIIDMAARRAGVEDAVSMKL